MGNRYYLASILRVSEKFSSGAGEWTRMIMVLGKTTSMLEVKRKFFLDFLVSLSIARVSKAQKPLVEACSSFVLESL